MIWHAVSSSTVAEVGHDAASGTLGVRFKAAGGKVSEYHHENVPRSAFHALKDAASVGSHYHRFIRFAKDARGEALYKARKIEPAADR